MPTTHWSPELHTDSFHSPTVTGEEQGAREMKVLFQNHSFTTERCGQFLDLTDDLIEVVSRSGVSNGMALVYSPHTTCSVVINENESGFISDFTRLMDGLVPLGAGYSHDDLEA